MGRGSGGEGWGVYGGMMGTHLHFVRCDWLGPRKSSQFVHMVIFFEDVYSSFSATHPSVGVT